MGSETSPNDVLKNTNGVLEMILDALSLLARKRASETNA
jgi:hypothetical protein